MPTARARYLTGRPSLGGRTEATTRTVPDYWKGDKTTQPVGCLALGGANDQLGDLDRNEGPAVLVCAEENLLVGLYISGIDDHNPLAHHAPRKCLNGASSMGECA